jgi:LysM repeat protein
MHHTPPARRRSRPTGAHTRQSPFARFVRRALIIATALAIVILVLRAVRANPRDDTVIAERELSINTLQPGEQVHRVVPVFKRPLFSYFRATRGLLALTDRRLIYLGVEPRDILAAPDLPPTFEQREFPLDETTRVSSGRTMLGLVKAVVITTPNETVRLGVPSAAAASADLLVASMSTRRDRAVAQATLRGSEMREIQKLRQSAEAQRRKAKYYVVRRGDALGGIATMWNTTTDRLLAWNHLTTPRIRVGQSLLVRPAF